MAAMSPSTASDRRIARVRQLVRVKFVSLPQELAPPPGIARPRLARALAALRDRFIRFIRAIGCLEAARP